VISLYQEFDPDVILLDLSMPHLDGFEVMARLRALIPAESYVPILVLTAMVTSEAKRGALSAGANDFLTKPFDVTEVLLRVKNLLETRRLHVELRQHNTTLESTVKERTQELASALTKLQATQQQVIQQERLHAFGVMAGGVAHDFNNVLSIVLGYGELALGDCEGQPGREKDAESLRMIVTAAQDGARMVTRLREFHRPEGSRLEASLPVDLNVLAQQAVSLTEPLWKTQALKDGIVIKVSLAGASGLPPVLGDPAELREVLTNLIFNAVHAMPGGGTITVDTRAEAEHVILEVSDTGSGMTEEVRRRCLEPFYTTKGDKGTGLGLAMVCGIAQRHGATMDLESDIGRGTTFRFRFPAAAWPGTEDGAAGIEWARPLKILVVDDQEYIREILTLFLAEDCHIAEAVSGGAEALERIGCESFDLLITDQAMPDMTGGQLAAAVKERAPGTRVILLTGFGAEESPGEGGDAIDLVVGKPVTKEMLRQAIARVVATEPALATR
jgi:signal transduction histidine kinase